jgi:hypothetical protein
VSGHTISILGVGKDAAIGTQVEADVLTILSDVRKGMEIVWEDVGGRARGQ